MIYTHTMMYSYELNYTHEMHPTGIYVYIIHKPNIGRIPTLYTCGHGQSKAQVDSVRI